MKDVLADRRNTEAILACLAETELGRARNEKEEEERREERSDEWGWSSGGEVEQEGVG